MEGRDEQNLEGKLMTEEQKVPTPSISPVTFARRGQTSEDHRITAGGTSSNPFWKKLLGISTVHKQRREEGALQVQRGKTAKDA